MTTPRHSTIPLADEAWGVTLATPDWWPERLRATTDAESPADRWLVAWLRLERAELHLGTALAVPMPAGQMPAHVSQAVRVARWHARLAEAKSEHDRASRNLTRRDLAVLFRIPDAGVRRWAATVLAHAPIIP